MFNWFWQLLYNLMKSLFFCIDFMLDIAGMLCGIEPITVDGEKQDIVYYFITSDIVVGAFEAVLVIGFILLFIFTAYSVFRSMGRLGEGKSAIQTCLDSAKTLLYFFLVPIIMTLGVVVVSTVMTSIYDATSMGNSSLGGMLFAAAADGAWNSDGDKVQVLNNFIEGVSGYDYFETENVESYFDLEEMDYLIGCLSGVVILVLIALSLFSFVERAVGIVFLFIVSPLSMSTTPLDEGARFKLWRDQVINKYLIAYGSIISINIFMLLVHTIQRVEFFDNSFLNQLARVAFLIGGAFACRKGTVIAGNLINQSAGTADRMENQAASAGIRALAGFAAGHTIGKLAHLAGMPLQHLKKDAKSAIHRSSDAKRSAKDERARQKYSEKLKAAEPKGKAGNSKGAAGQNGATGTAGAAGSNSQSKLESILKNTKTTDPNSQKATGDSQHQTEKPQAAISQTLQMQTAKQPKEKDSKKKPSMAEALSGRSTSAVNESKEQSAQQEAKPMNQHMQGKVSGAIQGRATGKDGKKE